MNCDCGQNKVSFIVNISAAAATATAILTKKKKLLHIVMIRCHKFIVQSQNSILIPSQVNGLNTQQAATAIATTTKSSMNPYGNLITVGVYMQNVSHVHSSCDHKMYIKQGEFVIYIYCFYLSDESCRISNRKWSKQMLLVG